MTTMFNDAKKEIQADLIVKRIPGAMFDEVIYADDTICISKNEAALTNLLQLI